MPRTIKLEKQTKRGTLIKLLSQAGSVILEREKKPGLVKTSRPSDAYTFCDNVAEARTQYRKLVAQARADGFVTAPARKSRKSPARRRKPTA